MIVRAARNLFKHLPQRIPFYLKSETPSRHNYINEQYKEYQKVKWSKFSTINVTEPSSLQKEAQEKQKKQVTDQVNKYFNEYRYDNVFDQERFISFLSDLSYYGSKEHFSDPRLTDLLVSVTNNVQFLEKERYFCVLFQFCSQHDIKEKTVWENLWEYLKNNSSKIDIESKLILLGGLKEYNFDLFKDFFSEFENEFLNYLESGSAKMHLVFQMLQTYREHDQGSESFNLTLQKFIIENIPDMKLNNLIQFLMHYALSRKEKLDDKRIVLDAIIQHLYKVMRFLNQKELVQVVYAYVKSGFGTDVFYKLVEERLLLLIPDMMLNELEQVLIIAANEERLKKTAFAAAETVLLKRYKEIRPVDLIQIYYLFNENGMGSEEFLQQLENHLYPSMYTAPIDNLAELVWSLQTGSKKQDPIMERAADVVIKRLDEMNVKHVTQFIWLLSDYYKRCKNAEESKLKEMYQKCAVKLLRYFTQYFDQVTIKDCALVMAAYVQNHPIPNALVDLIYAVIMNKSEEELNSMETWDLSTLCWGFQYVEGYSQENIGYIFDTLHPVAMEMLEEMNIYEMLNTLRAYILTDNESEDIIQLGVNTCLSMLDQFQNLQQVYFALFVFTKTKFDRLENQDKLIEKLVELSQKLRAVAPTTPEEELDRKTKEFLVQEEVAKYKQ